MFNWWRNLTIPQRFLIRGTIGLTTFGSILAFGPSANPWLKAFLLFEFLSLVAGHSALDSGFATWRPTSRSGRAIRVWM